MKDFMAATPWLIALSAGFLAQFSKFLADLLRHRKLNFTRLVSTGGMPSAHSASVAALSTSIGFHSGMDSPLFAATVFFSLVVMYDAAGLRRAAGFQARILNRIVDDHYAHRKFKPQRLSELLGHTPFEVLVGAVLGVLYGMFWHV